MIAALVVLIDALFVWYLWTQIRERNRWPEPKPRAHVCDRCFRTFHSSQMLGYHVRAEHPDTFEDRPWHR